MWPPVSFQNAHCFLVKEAFPGEIGRVQGGMAIDPTHFQTTYPWFLDHFEGKKAPRTLGTNSLHRPHPPLGLSSYSE